MSHSIRIQDTVYSIAVEEIEQAREPIQVEHNLLDTNHSTYQYIGSRSKTGKLTFVILTGGNTTLDAIDQMVRDGSVFVYTDDQSVSGSYIGSNFSSKRLQALNHATPVYRCTMDMVKLDATGSLYYQ